LTMTVDCGDFNRNIDQYPFVRPSVNDEQIGISFFL
jgi:hypothetical protein